MTSDTRWKEAKRENAKDGRSLMYALRLGGREIASAALDLVALADDDYENVTDDEIRAEFHQLEVAVYMMRDIIHTYTRGET